MTFQNLMKDIFRHVFQKESSAVLGEISDEGFRYHNSRYEVTIQRERKVEECLQKAYPGNTFIAYFTNEYYEKEISLDVIVHIKDVKYVLSCDVDQIEEGKVNLFCGFYRHGKRLFDATLEEISPTFPDIDQQLIKALETHPSYRLYFVTRDVVMDYFS